MDNALEEFARQGYGASSVNAVCSAQGISKGIIYHYFKTKDALYLACVEECFDRLTDYLRTQSQAEQGSTGERLERYFTARMVFFREHPVYQRIFCEAVISPPAHLAAEIQARKQPFDDLNIAILENLLQPLPLRPDVTVDEVVDTFRQFQDFINANDQAAVADPREFCLRDRRCKKALEILLYGVIDREDKSRVG